MSWDKEKLARRLKSLMELNSISGSENEVGELVISLLQEDGLQAGKNPLDDGRFNVVAGPENADILFCTHMDTVPPFIPYSREGDTIHGRGACDAKGIIVAMLEAGRVLREQNQVKTAYLFVVSEETDHRGALVARETLPHRARYLFVGEPTCGSFASGQKGALKCTLKFSGKACHSAYPEQGHSAVEDMLDVLADIRNHSWGDHEKLGVGTVNIGQVRGGVAHNVVPPYAEADLLFRLVESSELTLERLRKLVGERAVIHVDVANEPVDLFLPEGRQGNPVAFNTDVPYLDGMGTPLLMGPGSILDAHTNKEKVELSEIQQACEDYFQVARQLLGK